jgi:glycosyltransferase involved in cell wall biosynthesis
MAGRLRVSVVVPVYDEAEMIGPCLDALLAQSVPADEIIVVDNNSTDATLARLTAYAGRVTVLREPRQGVHHARTAGLNAAGGDVLARIDADTRVGPGWVGHLHTAFTDARVRAVTGPVRYYDIALPRLVDAVDLLLRQAWVRCCQGRLDWVHGANMAIRAQAWRSVRGSLCDDRGVHEDLDLGIHLYAAGERVAFVPALVAGTSSRRIRDRAPDFRAYLLMTERGYARHAAVVRRGAYHRAWVTARLLMSLRRPVRALHLVRSRGGRGPAAARKNPMSATGPGGASST